MRPRTPTIGVTTSRGRGRLMWLFNRFALWRAGARAVRLEPRRPFAAEEPQGLVLGGGDDIDADLSGAELVRPLVRLDPERDRLELELLRFAIERKLPVLGICCGAQMVNVALGGTLHGDIHDVYADAPRLRTPLPRKTIRLEPRSRLSGIIGGTRDRVNALHHQAVDRLGRGLRVAARDEHGIVQAIECPSAPFLLGVQWHPEFMVFDPGQQKVYRALAAAAARWGAAARPSPAVTSNWRPSGAQRESQTPREMSRC